MGAWECLYDISSFNVIAKFISSFEWIFAAALISFVGCRLVAVIYSFRIVRHIC